MVSKSGPKKECLYQAVSSISDSSTPMALMGVSNTTWKLWARYSLLDVEDLNHDAMGLGILGSKRLQYVTGILAAQTANVAQSVQQPVWLRLTQTPEPSAAFCCNLDNLEPHLHQNAATTRAQVSKDIFWCQRCKGGHEVLRCHQNSASLLILRTLDKRQNVSRFFEFVKQSNLFQIF